MDAREEGPDVGLEPRFAPRRIWLAVLLSLLVPGLGHLYAGAPLRGILVFFAWLTVGFAVIWGILVFFLGSPGSLAVGVVICLPIVFAVYIDAGLVARSRRHAPRSRWNRWWWYLAYPILFSLVFNRSTIHPMFAALDLLRPVQLRSLPSDSMAPTLIRGDYVLTRASGRRARESRRGDLVMFRLPHDPLAEYVKRVVGLPGDVVEIRSGRLIVNGVPATEEPDGESAETVRESLGERRYEVRPLRRDRYGPKTIPEGTLFVLGDNRSSSADSRVYGPVPIENLVAIPLGVFFSWDAEFDGEIRWDRCGIRF